MSSWNSYPKIWAIGHPSVSQLFDDNVIVEEKIDGSQFSAGIFDGLIQVRSKGKEFPWDAPEKMFQKAVNTILKIRNRMVDGLTYRFEYLEKEKHNTLKYSRVPKDNLVLLDVNIGDQHFVSRRGKSMIADELGLEVVPLISEGKIENAEHFKELLDRESFLGGCKIEGVVVKNYSKFTPDKKAMFGKYVSEDFKEIHRKEWKVGNPGSNDIIFNLSAMFRGEARWVKAVQYLRDVGELENSPKDIGKLMKRIQEDFFAECQEDVAKELLKWAMPKVQRSVARGVPEWYKKRLLESQFGDKNVIN